MQLSTKQIDPRSVFVQIDRQKKEMQWAMGSVNFVSEKFKKFRFSSQKDWSAINLQKNTKNAKLNGTLSISSKM